MTKWTFAGGCQDCIFYVNLKHQTFPSNLENIAFYPSSQGYSLCFRRIVCISFAFFLAHCRPERENHSIRTGLCLLYNFIYITLYTKGVNQSISTERKGGIIRALYPTTPSSSTSLFHILPRSSIIHHTKRYQYIG